MIIIITNLIYIAHFDTNGILRALFIVIKYIQTQYMYIWTYMKQSFTGRLVVKWLAHLLS